jgi:pyroglutamyl-peptidase
MATIKLRVLVTGFLPFGGVATNPSGDAALALDRKEIKAFNAKQTLVLGSVSSKIVDVLWSNDTSQPTARGAADEIESEIERVLPHVVISLGMTKEHFRVEQVATDMDKKYKDNRGWEPEAGRREYPDEPLKRPTSLPYEKIEAAWKRIGITKVQPSYDAGGFICDDVFYRVMRIASSKRYGASILRAGFIHVPKPGIVEQTEVDAAVEAAVKATLSDIRDDEGQLGARRTPAR